MKKIVFPLIIVLITCFSVYSQETKEPEVKQLPNEKKTPQKTYDLSEQFSKKATFLQLSKSKISTEIITEQMEISQVMKFELKKKCEIQEVKDKKVTKMKIEFITASTKNEIMKNKFTTDFGGNHRAIVKIKNNKMKIEKQSQNFPELIRQHIEGKRFSTYYPPKKAVAVGQEWKHESKITKSNQSLFTIESNTITLKLEKNEQKNNTKIAHIKLSSTGSGSGKQIYEKLKITIESSGEYLLDIEKHKILEYEITSKLSGKNDKLQLKITSSGSIINTFPSKNETKQPQSQPEKDKK